MALGAWRRYSKTSVHPEHEAKCPPLNCLSTVFNIKCQGPWKFGAKQFFFFPSAQSFIVSIWFKAWERLLGGERLPSGCRERLRQESDPRGAHQGPSKASGLQRLLVVLEGEPLEEIITQTSLWR